jgi:hypothetical protein
MDDGFTRFQVPVATMVNDLATFWHSTKAALAQILANPSHLFVKYKRCGVLSKLA